MEQIIITRNNGSTYPLEDKSVFRIIKSGKQSIELRNNDVINFSIESIEFFAFNIGDHFTYQERKYSINQLPRVAKNSSRHFVYDLTFEGVQFDLRRANYDVNIDTTGSAVYGETLTANLELFLNVLISNANRVFPNKWVLGQFPTDTETKTIVFSEEENCLNVLQTLCEEYNIDFTITSINSLNTLNLLQVGEEFDYTFEQGIHKGLYSLSREKVSSSDIVTRLKVYGSTRNINTKYRSDRLVLAGKNKSNSYIDNEVGILKHGIYEAVGKFEEVYPRRKGKVTSLGDDIYKFKDSSMDFDLKAKADDGVTTLYLLNEVSAKIHFNTGNLAGYEFEVHNYNHATKEFHIIKFVDGNDYDFPSKEHNAFRFAVGDEYVILDINMPQAYIDNAEQELYQKGLELLNDQSEPKVQYNLQVDALFLSRLLDASVQPVFNAGDFIRIKDDDLGINRAIRILSVERDLSNPFIYSLTISDSKVTTSLSTTVIGEIDVIKNIIKNNNLNDPARARRNWRDAQEVLDMVYDPEGDYYSEKIKPNSIETMHLQVGAKSMQFNLVDSTFEPNLGGNPNAIKWKACKLVHFTIDDTKIREWSISAGQLNLLANKAYYMYARCNKNNTLGAIEITELQKRVDEGNYYYFLIGIINSYDDNVKARELSLMYGFTTVSGRFIRTGRIQSSGGGGTYFDLDSGEIYGRITFTSDSPAIQQVSDSIKVAVKNEVLNSGNFENTKYWSLVLNGGNGSLAIDNKKLQYNWIGSVKDWNILFNTSLLDKRFKFSLGKEYVIELVFKSKQKGNYMIQISNTDQSNKVFESGYFNVDADIEVKKVFTFKATQAGDSNLIRIFCPITSLGGLEITSVFIGEGNKPAGWAPAYDDLMNKISFLNTTIDGNVIATGLLMVGSGNQSNAGISGLNEAGPNSVRLWAGGTANNRSKARWSIADNGVERTYHPNGNIATVRGVVDGSFVFDFYHETGPKLFELSPNRGLVNVAYIPESFVQKHFFFINQTSPLLNKPAAENFISSKVIVRQEGGGPVGSEYFYYYNLNSNFACYEYNNGTNPTNAGYSTLNGYKKQSDNRELNINNGWYGFDTGLLHTEFGIVQPLVNIDYLLYFIENGKVTKTAVIVINK